MIISSAILVRQQQPRTNLRIEATAWDLMRFRRVRSGQPFSFSPLGPLPHTGYDQDRAKAWIHRQVTLTVAKRSRSGSVITMTFAGSVIPFDTIHRRVTTERCPEFQRGTRQGRNLNSISTTGGG